MGISSLNEAPQQKEPYEKTPLITFLQFLPACEGWYGQE